MMSKPRIRHYDEEAKARKREYNRQYRAKNKDRLNAASRVWYQQNKEHVRQWKHADYAADPGKYKERLRAYYAAHPELRALYAKRSAVRSKYGIELEEYERRLEAQNYQCALCGRTMEPGRHALDHCHVTGQIRGFLCQSCNTGLGYWGDDPVFLDRAAAYLKRHE